MSAQKPDAPAIFNPWRTQIENILAESNYLRGQEWQELLEELDGLYAKAARITALETELAKKDQEIAEIRAVSVARRDAVANHHLAREWERQLSSELAEAKAQNAELLEVLQRVLSGAVHYQLQEDEQCVIDARALIAKTTGSAS